MTIYLATNDFSKFGEEYLNIKLNIKGQYTCYGGMYIEPGQHYSTDNNKILFYKYFSVNLLDYECHFIPIYFTIISRSVKSKKGISIENNFKTESSEILLKKIILPLHLYNKNSIDKGELICELYKFNGILYLYFMTICKTKNGKLKMEN